MRDYRLYCLGGDSRIAQGEWIDADNDAAAIELVRAKRLRLKCEIWDKNRLVAEIPAYSG